jgi:hypothetical protein
MLDLVGRARASIVRNFFGLALAPVYKHDYGRIELGYEEDEIDKVELDLLHGENFQSSFLRIVRRLPLSVNDNLT